MITPPKDRIASPAVKTASKPKFVTVASKLPMHINLQLCKKTEQRSTGRWGESNETVYIPTGMVVTIRGTAYPSGTPPKRFPKAPEMIEDAGYALTHSVDADFFEEWMRQNAATDMVRNGIIKAAPTMSDLEAMAEDHKDVRSGLDALLHDDDPRSPKPINAQIEVVKPDTRRAA